MKKCLGYEESGNGARGWTDANIIIKSPNQELRVTLNYFGSMSLVLVTSWYGIKLSSWSSRFHLSYFTHKEKALSEYEKTTDK